MALKWIEQKLQLQPVTSWAIVLNLWVLLCLYSEWLFRHFREVAWVLLPIWIPIGFFNMFVLFAQFHFSLVIFAICLGLMGLALILARPRPLVMLSFLLFLLAYAAWPLTVQNYEPAIQPAAGYNMQLVTQRGYFGSAIKRKLSRYEGNACDYELLGWDERNILYYESNCFGKLWRYDPISRQNLSISRIPAGTEFKPAFSGSISAQKVAHPTGFENDGLSIYMDGYAYSEDGKWTAIESKHIYSVHDVVVFSKE